MAAAALAAGLLGAGDAGADEFTRCRAELREHAVREGISHRTFNRALKGVLPDPSVIEAMDRQPEFVAPVWDYLAGLVDPPRIATGVAQLAEWAAVLARAEERFGVDRHVLVAVWGVETNYGAITGRRPLMRSLATTACYGRRQRYFREELVAALRIVQAGEIAPEDLRGSWAGAFGQTQFMPSTFLRVAIDFDEDGRRDIVASVPDALASTANYLRDAGWKPGEPWGYEVALPAGYDGASGRRTRRPLDAWGRAGVRDLEGRPLKGAQSAALLLPAGARGPAFMVFRNFDAIVAYNASESYALAIAHLADRLRGGGPIRTAWPTDDPGLTRAERRELQELLAVHGFDAGKADGIIGAQTREAVRDFQKAAGLPADGYAGMRVLRALRERPLPPVDMP